MKLSNKWLSENTTETSRKRGEQLYRTQGMRPARLPSGFEAMVYGTNDYKVNININRHQINARCSCPYSLEGYCKHIAAVTYAIINGDIEENPEKARRGLSDLEKSGDVNFIEKYYDPASTDLKRLFNREDMQNNQSLRMRFLQERRNKKEQSK